MSDAAHDAVAKMIALMCLVLSVSLLLDIWALEGLGLNAETAGVGVAGAALLAGIGMLAAWNRHE